MGETGMGKIGLALAGRAILSKPLMQFLLMGGAVFPPCGLAWDQTMVGIMGSKITADDDCSHEIKRNLLLGRKAMTNLDSILNSRDIILSKKVCLVKAVVFPIIMYGCDSWTIKKVERRIIDAFELCCWRRLLGVPYTARSNQSILKEINSEYSLEGLMIKLKFWYFSHLMTRADSL